MSSFKSFQAKYNGTIVVNNNFVKLWERYKCILLRCPLLYVGHYWKAMLEGLLFLTEEIALLVDDVTSVRTSPVETVQLSEMKIKLLDIAKLLNKKVDEMGLVMYKRSQKPPKGMNDISYNGSVFKLTKSF